MKGSTPKAVFADHLPAVEFSIVTMCNALFTVSPILLTVVSSKLPYTGRQCNNFGLTKVLYLKTGFGVGKTSGSPYCAKLTIYFILPHHEKPNPRIELLVAVEMTPFSIGSKETASTGLLIDEVDTGVGINIGIQVARYTLPD